MLENNFAISELQRKLSNLIRIGIIKEIDHEKAKARVETGEILTDWLPWITMRAGEEISWFAPSINEQVIVFSPLGELSLSVVLPGIYQKEYSAPEKIKSISSLTYKDGTKLSYDQENHHLKILVVDKLTLQVEDSSIEMSKSGIKLKGKRIDLN